MNPLTCPNCGKQADHKAAVCPDCGQAITNGAAPPLRRPVEKPPVPAELAGVVFHKMTPAQIERERQTFDMEEFMAALREVERTGGLELKDFIHELEQGDGVP